MPNDLSIADAELHAAADEMTRAAGAFGTVSRVSTGADYGSGMVSSAVSDFSAALRGACGAIEERLHVNAHWTSSTVESFTALDGQVAAAVSA
ncbi:MULTISPECIES: hypothetical protein [Leucobacter]|uniref:Excreted virulence factor EspC (Type VII ESX diderm) n=2 Tax=Leucobacter TaxID=55968 RepID=A0ABN3B1A8_9MICO|nr:hypothetical protein [Leucobacter manosquensis]MBS3181855.1 hypothetical protein [Leucobacter manosquensis]